MGVRGAREGLWLLEAVLIVDETDTPTVQVGQKAPLNIDAYAPLTFDGLVTEVGSSPILEGDPDLQGLTPARA